VEKKVATRQMATTTPRMGMTATMMATTMATMMVGAATVEILLAVAAAAVAGC
jgi:hypothetical protein